MANKRKETEGVSVSSRLPGCPDVFAYWLSGNIHVCSALDTTICLHLCARDKIIPSKICRKAMFSPFWSLATILRQKWLFYCSLSILAEVTGTSGGSVRFSWVCKIKSESLELNGRASLLYLTVLSSGHTGILLINGSVFYCKEVTQTSFSAYVLRILFLYTIKIEKFLMRSFHRISLPIGSVIPISHCSKAWYKSNLSSDHKNMGIGLE